MSATVTTGGAIHDAESRYHMDSTFHRAVNLMAEVIETAAFSPDDARAAMLCALLRVESRRPPVPIRIGNVLYVPKGGAQ